MHQFLKKKKKFNTRGGYFRSFKGSPLTLLFNHPCPLQENCFSSTRDKATHYHHLAKSHCSSRMLPKNKRKNCNVEDDQIAAMTKMMIKDRARIFIQGGARMMNNIKSNPFTKNLNPSKNRPFDYSSSVEKKNRVFITFRILGYNILQKL